MQLCNDVHLTYCTNIHAGESWPDVWQSLKAYVPELKKRLSPEASFGIGLRLSDQASHTLIDTHTLATFQNWLKVNDLYVFTMNGFPYGNFHRQRVKDDVHHPDWTTPQRRDYTIRLARIMAQLPSCPTGFPTNNCSEAGISTSPISYRLWYNSLADIHMAMQKGCLHMAEVVKELIAISLETGKIIHLDIEPEPDGLIDHVADTIAFFNETLIPIVAGYLVDTLSVTHSKAEDLARTHLQLCYDVCHFAVMYENPLEAIKAFQEANIGIGKIQLSAALKATLSTSVAAREPLAQAFQSLIDPTYLHQVVAHTADFSTTKPTINYPDLPQALAHIYEPHIAEWRTHFHVPLFCEDFGLLQATQEDIKKILSLQKAKPVTKHLEVETYTWEVLPESLKIPLLDSIEREIQWVLQTLNE